MKRPVKFSPRLEAARRLRTHLQWARSLYGAETSSRRQFVLVDDTAETIAAQNTSITGWRHRRRRPSWLRRRERQRSMWPVPVYGELQKCW